MLPGKIFDLTMEIDFGFCVNFEFIFHCLSKEQEKLLGLSSFLPLRLVLIVI